MRNLDKSTIEVERHISYQLQSNYLTEDWPISVDEWYIVKREAIYAKTV